jgi:flagellar FliJ protein
MAFRFPLQKVVDLKSNQKAQAEWGLAKALARAREEEKALRELERNRQSLRDRLDESARKPVCAGELAEIERCIRLLDDRILSKRADLERALKAVDASRQHLVERTLDEKVWLRARERALERYRAFMLKKEQQEIDEIALLRAETN